MVNQEKVKEAIKLLLEGIGEDTGREGLLDTPDRIARMYEELCAGMEEDPSKHLSKTFHTDNTEMVLEKDIVFHSLCEHHILPFFGKVSIGYIPDGGMIGLSKLARLVDTFAHRLQVQERLTSEVCRTLFEELQPKGVIVVCEAGHLCMKMRGVEKQESVTTTMDYCGAFEDVNLRNEFMRLL